jgi:hypothetical protein
MTSNILPRFLTSAPPAIDASPSQRSPSPLPCLRPAFTAPQCDRGRVPPTPVTSNALPPSRASLPQPAFSAYAISSSAVDPTELAPASPSSRAVALSEDIRSTAPPRPSHASRQHPQPVPRVNARRRLHTLLRSITISLRRIHRKPDFPILPSTSRSPAPASFTSITRLMTHRPTVCGHRQSAEQSLDHDPSLFRSSSPLPTSVHPLSILSPHPLRLFARLLPRSVPPLTRATRLAAISLQSFGFHPPFLSSVDILALLHLPRTIVPDTLYVTVCSRTAVAVISRPSVSSSRASP